jgi:hypothetical protein
MFLAGGCFLFHVKHSGRACASLAGLAVNRSETALIRFFLFHPAILASPYGIMLPHNIIAPNPRQAQQYYLTTFNRILVYKPYANP